MNLEKPNSKKMFLLLKYLVYIDTVKLTFSLVIYN